MDIPVPAQSTPLIALGRGPDRVHDAVTSQARNASTSGFLQEPDAEAMSLLEEAVRKDPQIGKLFNLGLSTLQGKTKQAGPGSVSSKDDAVFYTPEATPEPEHDQEPAPLTSEHEHEPIPMSLNDASKSPPVPDRNPAFSFPATTQPDTEAIHCFNRITALRSEVSSLEQMRANLLQQSRQVSPIFPSLREDGPAGRFNNMAPGLSSTQVAPAYHAQFVKLRKTIDSSKVVSFYAREGVREMMRIQADVGAFWLTYESQLKGDYKSQWNAVRAGFKGPHMCTSFVVANMTKIIKLCPPTADLVQSSPPTSLISDLVRANSLDGSIHQATSGIQRKLDNLNELRARCKHMGMSPAWLLPP